MEGRPEDKVAPYFRLVAEEGSTRLKSQSVSVHATKQQTILARERRSSAIKI